VGRRDARHHGFVIRQLLLAGLLGASLAGAAHAADSRPPVAGGEVLGDAAAEVVASADIREVGAFTDATGRFGVRITLATNGLSPSVTVTTHLDVDGDPSTGSTTGDLVGADRVVRVRGSVVALEPPTLVRSYGPGVPTLTTTPPSLTAVRSGTADLVWSIAPDELGVVDPAVVRIAVVTKATTGAGDRAPDGAGTSAFAGRVGTLTGPWPAAPALVRPPAFVPRPPPAGGPAVPFALPRFALGAAGHRVRVTATWQYGQGRASWRLRLVGRRDGRRMVKTVSGGGAASATPRRIDRVVPMPRRWWGGRVRATFTAGDGTTVITRTRILRLRR